MPPGSTALINIDGSPGALPARESDRPSREELPKKCLTRGPVRPNLPNVSLATDLPDADRDRAHLRALAHPLRLRILSLLTAAPMTAAEVARELGANHANVSYHLRQLHNAGIIEIAGEEKISGGVAKRYRHDFEKEVERPETPPQRDAQANHDHRLVYAAMAVELQRRAAAQRPSVTNHLTDAELWIDPAAWVGIRDRVEAASDDLHRAAQPPRTPGAIRVNATIALFEMEEPGR